MKSLSGTGLSKAFARVFDVTCSAAGLLLLLPVFAEVAVAIILDDGLPIFFSQMRVGRDGTFFRIWKFRTMRRGSQGSPITASGDDRVTRAGARLRKYKLDELPQLINVLKGDMSLIGPRPEVPEYVQFQAPIWQVILEARPGITDLATLLYRDEEKILSACPNADTFYRETVLPAKLFWNLAYLRSRSFRRDLKLIFLTIRFSLFPRGFNPDLIKRTFAAGVGNE
jgi:lipopolysaccharide/colanic/teichoic acid biosynthesis glycosyltransferase